MSKLSEALEIIDQIPSKPSPPKKRFEGVLKVSGHTKEQVIDNINELARRLHIDGWSDSIVSGGGWSWESFESPDQTEEKYKEQLAAYLEAHKVP